MLSKHAGLQYHLCSEAKLSEFLRVYRTPSRRSNHMLTTELQKVVQKNRAGFCENTSGLSCNNSSSLKLVKTVLRSTMEERYGNDHPHRMLL